MKTYISILRGINVGGQKKIKMTDLQIVYEGLKFKDVKTYIQSGNVVFKAIAIQSHSLETKIEEAIFKRFGFEVPVIIKTADEMKKLIATNPFLKIKGVNLEKLHVTFLAELPDEAKMSVLADLDFSPDKFVIKGKEIFLQIPNSYGTTKLSNNFFESKLKVRATTRNWNTVNTLVELAG